MKMIHKQFQYPTSDGNIDVQFNLEFDGSNTIVTNIQLNSSYKTGLPNNPTLEYVNGSWVFAKWFKTIVSEIKEDASEYIDNDLSKGIITEIIRIKEQETPNFSNQFGLALNA